MKRPPKPQPAPHPSDPPMPLAVRALISKVRIRLREKSSTGSAGDVTTVSVLLGWPEVRGIYAMSTAVAAARASRDEAKAAAKAAESAAARTEARAKDQLAHVDLLNNRAIVALFIDIERILSGENVGELGVRSTLQRVRTVVAKTRPGRRAAR